MKKVLVCVCVCVLSSCTTSRGFSCFGDNVAKELCKNDDKIKDRQFNDAYNNN